MMGGGNEEMKEVINDLVEALKADGWRLAESKELLSLDEFKLIRKENGGEEMSARALVVKYAKGLPDLQDQLIDEDWIARSHCAVSAVWILVGV